MQKKRHAPPGSPPATLLPHLVGGQTRPPEITIVEYDKTSFSERRIADLADLPDPQDSNRVTWINIDGLGDLDALTTIGRLFDLHPLALEDVLNTGQRPKAEQAPGYLFVVAQMVYPNWENVLCAEQVSMFLGRNFLITVQEEGEYDAFDPVRERLRTGAGSIRKSKADYLAYALLDSIIDHFYPALDRIGTVLEDLEDALLLSPSRKMVFELHAHRRQLTQLRRIVWPMRDVVNALLHDSSGFIAKPTHIFLRDCYDHTVQLMDLVESYKELTSSLMELYHSSVSLRTNEVMRVLTVITSIFIPLTFIAGVYGMNFAPQSKSGEPLPWNMPELYTPHGYIVVMAIMLAIAIVQILVFKKIKWL